VTSQVKDRQTYSLSVLWEVEDAVRDGSPDFDGIVDAAWSQNGSERVRFKAVDNFHY
jgi:hypothetical protein